MAIKSIGDAGTSADAVQLKYCPRSSRQRRRQRRQGRSTSVVLLVRAALAVLLIDASGGMLLVRTPACSKLLRPGVRATSHPLQVSALASWERRPLSRRYASTNVEDSELASTGGAADGEDTVVHTLLIDNYDSYTYNLFQLLAVVNGRAPFVVYNDDDGGDLWKAIERMGRTPDNIVISPGPGRPDVPKDFGMCAQALREVADIPILGVCLGHEGLGIAHGATVSRAAEPMHGRLSPVFHDGEDALFRGIPQGSRVVRYHSLVVDWDTLPAAGALKATAWTEDGVLMAMRHEERPHWGVQFHPESVGTRHGPDVVRNFRDLTVAWRKTADARGRSGCGSGSGGGSGLSEDGVSFARGVSDGAVRKSWGLPQAAAGEVAAAGHRPAIASSTALPDKSKIAEGVPAPAPDSAGLPRSGHPSTAKRRRSFVLHVKTVEMAGGALKGDREGSNPDASGQTASGTAPTTAMPDTEHAFRALYGDDPTAWWLDSSSQRPGLAVDGQAKARFTFMGGADGPLSQTIECYGEDRLVIQQSGGSSNGRGGDKAGRRRNVRANIMDYLKVEMAKMGHTSDAGMTSDNNDNCGLEIRMVGERMEDGGFSFESGDSTGGAQDNNDNDGRRDTLPFDFVGGFVGFLGYELRHEANDVLRRSAGGSEWDWQPSDGGRWEDATFEGADVVKHDPGVQAESAVAEMLAGGFDGGADGSAAARRNSGGGGGGDVPLGFLVFVDRFVAFDHQESKAYVLALSHADAPPGGGDVEDIEVAVTANQRKHDRHRGTTGTRAGGTEVNEDTLGWIQRTAATLCGLSSSDGVVAEDNAAAASGGAGMATACAMDVSRSRYEQSLEEIMRLVEEGETYEVCLTNQIVCERPKGDGATTTSPLDLYSRLRRANPAPYAAYIVHDPHRRLSSSSASKDGAGPKTEESGHGRSSFAVCCSSPEKFLQVDGNGWVESKPIKGTVKRGNTPAEDLILATDLAKGEKNMAENLMIVDLVRNDLGRVCQTGSVSVPKLMHVESYATVHQLVSTIRGRLRPNCGALDAIAAAFPGGSMTGAPKQRTMEIIDRLERGRSRGIYSGSIGFLSVDGAADFNIVIRTAVVTPRNVTVGAGGAVIALSEVDDEYDEMLLKATSVLGALGHEKRPGRRGPPGSEQTRSKLSSELNNASPEDKRGGAVRFDRTSAVEVSSGRRQPTARNGDGRRSADVRPSLGGSHRGGVDVSGQQQSVQQRRRQAPQKRTSGVQVEGEGTTLGYPRSTLRDSKSQDFLGG